MDILKKLAPIVLVAAFAPMTTVAESLRCGSRLILVGSSSAELQALCGDPVQVTNGAVYNGAGSGRLINGETGGSVEQIQVETWVYNFGPNQLMERIRIENGVVVSIASLGYGYNEP